MQKAAIRFLAVYSKGPSITYRLMITNIRNNGPKSRLYISRELEEQETQGKEGDGGNGGKKEGGKLHGKLRWDD